MAAKRPGSGVSPFRAVTLALAGTLGVGNIVGVASAIRIGGAGAIFWMWISALVAMILKYAEIVLAIRHQRVRTNGSRYGGAPYYIRDGLTGNGYRKLGAAVSVLFAGLIILNAFSMGCVIQVNAVSSALRGVLGIPLPLCAVVLLLLTVPVILRNAEGISALTEYIVPLMSFGYLMLAVLVLILRREALSSAIVSIFRNAFRPESVGGGLIGFLTCPALRVGFMRGLLSNEAGCGTAPTAHAAADAQSPAAQGVWGIFEVFVDTILLCTATALVILVDPDAVSFSGDDVMMTIHAFAGVLGNWSAWFLAAAILCFGYATVICWANYGAECIAFLSPKKSRKALYRAAFLICIPIGVAVAPGLIWTVSDFAIAALTTGNLLSLFSMRKEIREETGRFLTHGKEAVRSAEKAESRRLPHTAPTCRGAGRNALTAFPRRKDKPTCGSGTRQNPTGRRILPSGRNTVRPR